MIFFLDESGHDLHEAPYEVRAAVAVPDEALWSLLQTMKDLERKHFGMPLGDIGGELKGKKLLSRKRFKHARQCGLLGEHYRRNLTRTFLQRGEIARKNREKKFVPQSHELAAYAQAGHAYVQDALNAARRRQCKAFAALVEKKAERPQNQAFLRKDYRYLLDRFSRHTQSISDDETGLMVFDQTETSDSRRLLQQMESYANETQAGYKMTKQLVPAPFFVDSRLTPVVQLADLVAYITNWSVRFGKATADKRDELKPFAKIVRELEWSGNDRDPMGHRWKSYGFFHVSSLIDRKDRERPRAEKEEEDTQSPSFEDRQRPHERGPKTAQGQLSLDLGLSTSGSDTPEPPTDIKTLREDLFGEASEDS